MTILISNLLYAEKPSQLSQPSPEVKQHRKSVTGVTVVTMNSIYREMDVTIVTKTQGNTDIAFGTM